MTDQLGLVARASAFQVYQGTGFDSPLLPAWRLRYFRKTWAPSGQCGLKSCLYATALGRHRFEHPVEVHQGGGGDGDERYLLRLQAATSGRYRRVLIVLWC